MGSERRKPDTVSFNIVGKNKAHTPRIISPWISSLYQGWRSASNITWLDARLEIYFYWVLQAEVIILSWPWFNPMPFKLFLISVSLFMRSFPLQRSVISLLEENQWKDRHWRVFFAAYNLTQIAEKPTHVPDATAHPWTLSHINPWKMLRWNVTRPLWRYNQQEICYLNRDNILSNKLK